MRRFEKIGGTERLRPAIHFSECTSLNGEIDFLVWQRRREMIGGAGWVRLDAVLREDRETGAAKALCKRVSGEWAHRGMALPR